MKKTYLILSLFLCGVTLFAQRAGDLHLGFGENGIYVQHLPDTLTLARVIAVLSDGTLLMTQTSHGLDTNPVTRQKSTADAQPSPDSTIIEYYHAEPEGWALDVKFLYLYDEERNKLQSISFVRNEMASVWEYRWKDDYTRDANDYLVKDIFSMWNSDSGQWYPTDMWEYTNDENGTMLTYLYSTWDRVGSQWKKSIKGEYSLNENGDADTVNYFTWDEEPGRWTSLEKNEITYDSGGNLTVKMVYAWDTVSNSWINDRKRILSYDVNSHCTEQLAYRWDTVADDWMKDGRLTYSYDAGGNQTGFVDYYWNTSGEQWIASLKYEYTYDGNGNRLTETGYEWIEEEWVYNQRRTHFYPSHTGIGYDLADAWQETLIYPVPAVGHISVRTGMQGQQQVQILDLSGRKIFETTFQGESCDLDLESLPSSAYFIRIIQPGGKAGVLRIVKW